MTMTDPIADMLTRLRNASSAEDALAKAFALGGPGDIGGTWVDGEQLGGLRRLATATA